MTLPTQTQWSVTPDITRPDPALCDALRQIGSATAAGELYNLGVTHPHMAGLSSWRKGKTIAGPALTLQCMPKRQDLTDSQEYSSLGMLHHHVIYPTQPGDIVVVDGRGEMEGDIIVAGDDGAIVVPVKLAAEVVKRANAKKDWEEFTRLKLHQGGDIRNYYPLDAAAQVEYDAWRAQKSPIAPI